MEFTVSTIMNSIVLILFLNLLSEVAPQIPKDWMKYIAPDMIEKYRGKSSGAVYSPMNFQGDISGITKDLLQSGMVEPMNNAISDQSKRWPDGVVPYILSDTFLAPDRFHEKEFIELAMEMIASSTSQCIRFIPRTDQINYVEVARGLNCASLVGKQGGKQLISLAVGCGLETIGGIQHELLHALGFYHEMSRKDRDNYIWINWMNVMPEFKDDFKIPTDAMTFGLPYDYESVMHYPYNAFAIDANLPTIIPKKPGQRIGQTTGLSVLDIFKLRKAYGCPGLEDLILEVRNSSTKAPETTTSTEIATGAFPGCSSWWQIKAGNTVERVASICRISVPQLRSLNNGILYDANLSKDLIVGQLFCCKLAKPLSKDGPYPRCDSWWEIEKNDTCQRIARICKISIEKLKLLNRGTLKSWEAKRDDSCGTLKVGQILCCRKQSQ